MTKASVTYEKVGEFRNFGQQYQAMHSGKFSKFLHALSRILKATKKVADELEDKMTFLNLEHAEKDSKGFAVMEKFTVKRGAEEVENERYRYTAAKSKDLHIAKRALLNEEVEVDCWEPQGDLLEFIPDDMDFHRWQIFAPFVLPEDVPDAIVPQLVERTAKQK